MLNRNNNNLDEQLVKAVLLIWMFLRTRGFEGDKVTYSASRQEKTNLVTVLLALWWVVRRYQVIQQNNFWVTCNLPWHLQLSQTRRLALYSKEISIIKSRKIVKNYFLKIKKLPRFKHFNYFLKMVFYKYYLFNKREVGRRKKFWRLKKKKEKTTHVGHINLR